jgi:PAS domain S-box-containing protein
MSGHLRETRIAPDRDLLLTAMALTAVIFVVSLILPVETAVGSLYLIVVLLGLRAASDRFSLIAAAVVTGLMVATALLAPVDAHLRTGLVNRALSIVVVWITAGLVRQYKRAQHDAVGQADRTQRYLDVAGVILMALDRAGTVQMINRQGAAVLGRQEEAIVGLNWFDHFVPERQRPTLRQLHADITHAAAGIEYYENPVVRADGTERLIAWHNTLLQDENGAILGTLSSGTDVTEEREANRRLRLSTKDLEDLKYALDQSAIVAITDVRGNITYANDKFCEISKFSRDELLGQNHRIINSGYHPPEFFRGLWQTIANGGIWRGEIRNRAKDGSIYWVDTTIVPFLDERGRPYQYMAIRNDITERKRAEALLREQTTLARLGEMAAVVAHEVKNPLAGIRGVLQVIGSRMPADSRDRAIVSDVQERLDVLNELLQDLLLFARPKEPKTAPVAVRPLIEDTVHQLKRDPGMFGVEVTVRGDSPTVQADAGQLQRALLNLLINAGQAMQGAGRIAITVQGADGACRITFQDTGPGIPADVRERIFEPFFTTKHRGTGLGLPTSRRIVERHGGTLSLETPPEGGTRASIVLPVG